MIKSIAKDTKRHIFNIKLRQYTTQTQLRNLFFNEQVTVNKNRKNEILNIPLDERIYVIEDIDCLTDVVLDRNIDYSKKIDCNLIQTETNHTESESRNGLEQTNINNNTNTINPYNNNNNEFAPLTGQATSNYQEYINPLPQARFQTTCNEGISLTQPVPQQFPEQQLPLTVQNQNNIVPNQGQSQGQSQSQMQNIQNSSDDSINLAFLLNLLDGILETPGRILIITTNDPDKLDKALIRPGRIDIVINVDFCNKDMIEEMFNYFYEITHDFSNFEYNKKITPAQMNKVLLDNFNSYPNAMKQLATICS